MASYYTYQLVEESFKERFEAFTTISYLTIIAFNIFGVVYQAKKVYKMLFQPGTFQLKNMNNLKPPKNENIQAAMKLMKAKDLKNNNNPYMRKRCVEESKEKL